MRVKTICMVGMYMGFHHGEAVDAQMRVHMPKVPPGGIVLWGRISYQVRMLR